MPQTYHVNCPNCPCHSSSNSSSSSMPSSSTPPSSSGPGSGPSAPGNSSSGSSSGPSSATPPSSSGPSSNSSSSSVTCCAGPGTCCYPSDAELTFGSFTTTTTYYDGFFSGTGECDTVEDTGTESFVLNGPITSLGCGIWVFPVVHKRTGQADEYCWMTLSTGGAWGYYLVGCGSDPSATAEANRPTTFDANEFQQLEYGGGDEATQYAPNRDCNNYAQVFSGYCSGGVGVSTDRRFTISGSSCCNAGGTCRPGTAGFDGTCGGTTTSSASSSDSTSTVTVITAG